MLRRALLILLLLISQTDYVWRGASIIFHAGINDFQDPYVGARLWLAGQNPYDATLVKATWTRETGNPAFTEVKTVYPTTTYLLLSPFALFGFRSALLLWWLVLMTSVYAIAWIIWKQKWFSPSLLSTAVLVSLYSPFHTALHGVNCAPLVLALALASCTIRSELYAGIILGLAICIKPQVAIWFLLIFVLQRKARALISCIATGVVIAAVSLAPYATRVPQLIHSDQSQYQKGFENGSSGDYAWDKSDRLSMVNLQPAIYHMTHSKNLANLIAGVIVVGCIGFWLRGAIRSGDELLILSALVVISILPIYRRTTDLGLLVLPLIWAWKNRDNSLASPIAICAALFFLPINSILARYDIYGPLSVIQSWNILILAILLIVAQFRQTAGKASSLNLKAASQAPQ